MDWIERETLDLFREEQTTIHRVHSGYEGWVERFGEDFIFCSREGPDLRQWADKIRQWAEEQGLLVDRIFWRQLLPNPTDQAQYRLLAGEERASVRTRCQELGIHYWIDFAAGYSNGFFLDQRENRRFLRQLNPRRLLNLFSYTCSFSVVAALAGAETCSVDIGKKALDWGKENFALNGQVTTGHRFMTDDAREAVRRMVRRGEMFDVIICDPPTFGRNREGKVWKIDKDLPELVENLLRILSPGGRLLLSTNFREWGEEHLGNLVPGKGSHSVPRPVDLPIDEGARSIWISS